MSQQKENQIFAWEGIASIVEKLANEGANDIHRERFSSTPYRLFLQMHDAVRSWQNIKDVTELGQRDIMQEGASRKYEGEGESDFRKEVLRGCRKDTPWIMLMRK